MGVTPRIIMPEETQQGWPRGSPGTGESQLQGPWEAPGLQHLVKPVTPLPPKAGHGCLFLQELSQRLQAGDASAVEGGCQRAREQDGATATHSMLPPTKRVFVKEREPTACWSGVPEGKVSLPPVHCVAKPLVGQPTRALRAHCSL